MFQKGNPAVGMVSGVENCKVSNMADVYFKDQILPDCSSSNNEEQQEEMMMSEAQRMALRSFKELNKNVAGGPKMLGN